MRTWPPGPPGRFLIGHLHHMRADALGFLTDCARRYGDFVPFRLLHRPCVLVSHPRLIDEVLVARARDFTKHFALRLNPRAMGNGLLTSEGDFWRRQRRMAAPAFHPSRLAGYAEMMIASAERMLAGFADGQVRDLHADMMALTLEIAAATLFGAELGPDAALVEQSVTDLVEAFSERFGSYLPWPEWLPTRANRRFARARRRLDAVVRRILAARRGGGDGDRRDLLSMLLRARDHEADGAAMTEAQLLDEVCVLLIAGHETTAAALAWTWHLLAAHPVAEARLHAELDEVLGDRPPTPDDLPRLRYAEQVITESMRVFPPVYIIGREAVADAEIGGHRVAAGTTVYIPQWVTHRDPRHFDRPGEFDPDRWSDGLAGRLPRGAYLPFGGGPRVCIGNAFAMTEAVLVLASLARRFRFQAVPGHPVVPWAGLTLRPKHGIRMRVVARRRAAVVRSGPVLRLSPEGAGSPGLSSSPEAGTRRTQPAGAV